MKKFWLQLRVLGLLFSGMLFMCAWQTAHAEVFNEELQLILSARDVMALVYLDDTQALMSTPSFDGTENAKLPTGQTVFIRDIVFDEYGNEWVEIETFYQGELICGYMYRHYLACSDVDFLNWEKEFVKDSGFETHVFSGDGVQYADVEMFPESYREALYTLKEAHPNWIFVRMDTGLDWNYVVDNQLQNTK